MKTKKMILNECLDGMRVVCSHEHHRRDIRRDGAQKSEAPAARHLDVEKHEIRPSLPNQLDGRLDSTCLTNHFDVRLCQQQPTELLTGWRLVVDHDRTHGAFHQSCVSGSV